MLLTRRLATEVSSRKAPSIVTGGAFLKEIREVGISGAYLLSAPLSRRPSITLSECVDRASGMGQHPRLSSNPGSGGLLARPLNCPAFQSSEVLHERTGHAITPYAFRSVKANAGL